MDLTNIPLFKEIIQQPTIFIYGTEEVLSKDILATVSSLHKKIAHFYNIGLDRQIDDFVAIQDELDIADFNNYNVIACGIDPTSKTFLAKLKTHSKKALVFFESIGFFKHLWEKDNVTIIESSLTAYIKQLANPAKEEETEAATNTLPTQSADFIGRTRELQLHEDFMRNYDTSACKIIGGHGIGKKALLNEVTLQYYRQEGHTFVVTFKDKEANANYILNTLYPQFVEKGIELGLSNDDVKNFRLDLNNKDEEAALPKAIEQLFAAFDKLTNARIVFYNVEMVLNKPKRGRLFQINNDEIGEFFHLLLQRDGYATNQNKIYFVSTQDFDFDYVDDDDFAQLIDLRPLSVPEAKALAKHSLTQLGAEDKAGQIDGLDDFGFAKTLGGNPQLIQLFARAAARTDAAAIINNEQLGNLSDTRDKVKHLMRQATFDKIETPVMMPLALFRESFSQEWLKEQNLSTNPAEAIDYLQKHLLADVDEDKVGFYYIPVHIRRYVNDLLKQEENTLYRELHNRIGETYWTKANQGSLGSAEAYQAALYHFEQAQNYEREKEFIQKAPQRYLQKAVSSYKQAQLEDAFYYFNGVFQHNAQLLDNRNMSSFLKSAVKSGQGNPEELFAKALEIYSNDMFIRNAYADYLFKNGKLDEAEALSRQSLEINNQDFVSGILFVQILQKQGKKEEAATELARLEEVLQPHEDLDESGRRNLSQVLNMRFNLLEHYTALEAIQAQAINLLKSDGVNGSQLDSLAKAPIARDDFSKIENATATVLDHEQADKRAKRTQEAIRRRQNSRTHTQSVIEILEATNTTNKAKIEALVKEAEEIVNTAHTILDNWLLIENSNFRALFSRVSVLRHEADLNMLKDAIERSYTEREKPPATHREYLIHLIDSGQLPEAIKQFLETVEKTNRYKNLRDEFFPFLIQFNQLKNKLADASQELSETEQKTLTKVGDVLRRILKRYKPDTEDTTNYDELIESSTSSTTV
ncbi:tetratricopeptide repeat protein [Microscilla marina]|uniref:Tetratricopeptide repeat domain protein n=1 Tax=Microscilla marina ATCC 23134 TaxID=313606 RepID=A1ZW82_MICM2|nr:hypothetical protein [Microscilla marina]EAY25320.1 hypothetical protein M23134_04501 [Microscilla marina ATCC 23134]